MTTTQQPEALRLADALEKCSLNSLLSPLMELATELRRQHARIEELEQVATTPAHEDARDAARYRWLRDNDWRNDEKMEPVIRLHLNAIWDEKIDAAMAEAKAKKKGEKQ